MPIRASWHNSAKLLWSKIRRRKSGGRAVKECVLTRGDLALWMKVRRSDAEREVSRGRSSGNTKGRRNGRGSLPMVGFGMSQMFATAKLANTPSWVKPEQVMAARNPVWSIGNKRLRAMRRDSLQARRPQPFQPPDADPHVRWCGRGPISDDRPLSRFSFSVQRYHMITR